ncbi:MAG: prolipoprotein diacylglyceryl transferase [Gammaproteobacteria bacterium]|nr:prolipoprotein diacylglyceryl transferase [Gammaproteobacteria bacterium]
MLTYPEINPIAFHVGPLSVHWYGLMYLIGFVGGWALLTWRVRHSERGFTADQISDILFYAALGIIVGGRVGYMLFYAWPDLSANPLLLFQIWKGGMSFHGGLIGVILAMWIYARKIGKSLPEVTDLLAPVIPIGLGAGRIGNFINSELWGRVTDAPWAMVFPNGGPLPRHPSQLYEFVLEGVVLFLILWIFSIKPRPRYAVSGLFLICYGLFRFTVEFFREPDLQKGYLAFGWLTEGQLLSFPMILLGIAMFVWAYWSNKRCNNI